MFCLYVYLCTMCMECPHRPEEDAGSPGTGVTDGYEPWSWRWELNPGLCKSSSALTHWAIIYIHFVWRQGNFQKPVLLPWRFWGLNPSCLAAIAFTWWAFYQPSLFYLKVLFLFHVYECFACIYSTSSAYLVPREARVVMDCSYGQLWTAMSVLGTDPGLTLKDLLICLFIEIKPHFVPRAGLELDVVQACLSFLGA